MANQHTVKKTGYKSSKKKTAEKDHESGSPFAIKMPVAEALAGKMALELLRRQSTPLMNKADEKAKTMPHFTLLATDNFTPILAQKWIELALEHGVPEDKLLEAKVILKHSGMAHEESATL